MSDTEEDLILPVADGPAIYPVIDNTGHTVGHVELPPLGSAVGREEFEHLKHEFMQLRNQVIRLQTLIKLLENRVVHH